MYDLILCKGFLTATETMSKYRRRLTKCLFSVKGCISHFGFLGDSYQRLRGRLAGEHHVLAVPDPRAERNVMDSLVAAAASAVVIARIACAIFDVGSEGMSQR